MNPLKLARIPKQISNAFFENRTRVTEARQGKQGAIRQQFLLGHQVACPASRRQRFEHPGSKRFRVRERFAQERLHAIHDLREIPAVYTTE